MHYWVYAQGQNQPPLLANQLGVYNAGAGLLQITSNVGAPGIVVGSNYDIYTNGNQQGLPDVGNCQNVSGLKYSFSIG